VVVIFSGVPEKTSSTVQFSRAIRLSAAKGGYATIVFYWWLLESCQKSTVTKAVSWVPIVGLSLPDQTDSMRIRLKVALLDVRSGSWDVFMPEPFSNESMSSIVTREKVDQSLIGTLKDQAYLAAAQEIQRRYVKP
jgi:hypothetical protein